MSMVDPEGRGLPLAMRHVGRVGSAAAPFAPSSISGLIGDYDFGDVTVLFTDTGRTAGVSADGNSIKGVTDKSTNLKHLTEATNAPLYKTGILNGQSMALFASASSQKLSTGTFGGLASNQACTIIAVVKYPTVDVTSASHGIVDLSDTGSTNRGPSFFMTANNSPTHDLATYRIGAAGGAVDTYDATTTGNVWVCKESASRRDLYLDGTSVASEVSAKTYTAPVNLFVGSLVGTVFPAGLYIGRVLIYDSALSDANRNYLQAGLKAAWGTP